VTLLDVQEDIPMLQLGIYEYKGRKDCTLNLVAFHFMGFFLKMAGGHSVHAECRIISTTKNKNNSLTN
jgi:hypothetical protein